MSLYPDDFTPGFSAEDNAALLADSGAAYNPAVPGAVDPGAIDWETSLEDVIAAKSIATPQTPDRPYVPGSAAAGINAGVQDVNITPPSGGAYTSESHSTETANSTDNTALNMGTFDKLQKGKGFKVEVENQKRQRLQEADAMNQNIGGAYDELGQAAVVKAGADQAVAATKAGDAGAATAAVGQMAEAVGLAGVGSTGLAQLAIAQASVVAKEQEEGAKAILKAETARANYAEQVNRIKSMQIDPFKLVSDQPLAYGLQNATSMMMAISGKPGMMQAATMLQKGMLDSLSKSVDAQMANLQNQRGVAAGFKTIYDMVSDENDDAQVRRNKVYGAYLASVEAMIESQLGQHDSEIINAQLGQQLAGLRAERATTENKNFESALKLAQGDAEITLRKYTADQQASVERARISEQRKNREQQAKQFDAEQRRKDQEREDAKKEKLEVAANGAVFRSSREGGNELLGMVYGETSSARDKARADLSAQIASADAVEETLSRLADLNAAKSGDAAAMARVGVENLFGAKQAWAKEVATLSTLAATQLASALGMAPISDTDIKKMQEAAGNEEAFATVWADTFGGDASSIRSTAQVMDFTRSKVNANLRAQTRPATESEIQGVSMVHGDDVLYESTAQGFDLPVPHVSVEIGPDGEPIYTGGARTVPHVGGKRASGARTRDTAGHTPDAFPGRGAEAQGILNPEPDSRLDKLRDKAVPAAKAGNRSDEVSLDKAPPYYRGFAEAMQESGTMLDGKQAVRPAKPQKVGNSEYVHVLDTPSSRRVSIPNYADDIAEIAHIAHYSDNDDERVMAISLLQDMSSTSDTRGYFARWAAENPQQFDRKGMGRITGEIE